MPARPPLQLPAPGSEESYLSPVTSPECLALPGASSWQGALDEGLVVRFLEEVVGFLEEAVVCGAWNLHVAAGRSGCTIRLRTWNVRASKGE